MTDHTLLAGPVGPAPAARPPASPSAAGPAAPPRRLGVGPLIAIVAGGVLLLALTFGGGMATAWAIGPLGGTSFSESGTDGPPQFGESGPQEGWGTPGQRPEDDSDSGSSSGTSNS